MTLIERIRDLQKEGTKPEVVPSPKLQEILSESGVEASIGQLLELTTLQVSKKLIEGGKKMVVVAKWPTDNKEVRNQLIVSICEDSVSFIGDTQSNQYLRMEGQDISNRELVEEYLARTFINPSKIRAVS